MTKVKLSEKIFSTVLASYGQFYERLNGGSAEKNTKDVLSTNKVSEQIQLLEYFLEDGVRGKKILEIGSGYGVFVISGTLDHGADVHGVEPSAEGFGGSFETSQELLTLNGLARSRIVSGFAEDLPFENESFDIVYSTNVFEHVQDPAKAFAEAIRVCKKDGLIQIVIPNYGSFYEGHYGCWYIPYMPKWIWKKYITYILHKDPSYADTLQTGLNYFSVGRILKPFEKVGSIQIIDHGASVAEKRVTTGVFEPYAGLQKVKRIVTFMRRIGLAHVVGKLISLTKSFSPLIITMRKKVTT